MATLCSPLAVCYLKGVPPDSRVQYSTIQYDVSTVQYSTVPTPAMDSSPPTTPPLLCCVACFASWPSPWWTGAPSKGSSWALTLPQTWLSCG